MKGPAMDEIRVRTFPHRKNPDGTWETICPSVMVLRSWEPSGFVVVCVQLPPPKSKRLVAVVWP